MITGGPHVLPLPSRFTLYHKLFLNIQVDQVLKALVFHDINMVVTFYNSLRVINVCCEYLKAYNILQKPYS